MKHRNIAYLLIFLCFAVPCTAHQYYVILAGGSGDRLWPLSDKDTPKQLLSVDGKSTLLEQAIERIEGIVPREHIWLCVTQSLEESVTNLVGHRVGRILVEPDKRDTAPAILYSCLHIQNEDPDATVLFTAADAYIPLSSYSVFRSYVEKAYRRMYTCQDAIMLFGVRPTYPATGYGYIEYNTLTEQSGFFQVSKFHEKPTERAAKEYLELGTMLWNIGMFGGAVSTFVQEFETHAPDVLQDMRAYMVDDASYSAIRKISIDYAVLERSAHVSVLPVAFPWCDVGNLRVFLSLQEVFDVQQSLTIERHAKNNLVSSPGMVALVGVDNLCVVQRGDIVLIVHQDYVEDIKAVVEECKKNSQFSKYV